MALTKPAGILLEMQKISQGKKNKDWWRLHAHIRLISLGNQAKPPAWLIKPAWHRKKTSPSQLTPFLWCYQIPGKKIQTTHCNQAHDQGHFTKPHWASNSLSLTSAIASCASNALTGAWKYHHNPWVLKQVWFDTEFLLSQGAVILLAVHVWLWTATTLKKPQTTQF